MIGLTKDAGFQIGVSKTVPYSVADVWELLTSQAGTAIWLGDGARLGSERGAPYETYSGTTGEVRSFHEEDRIRLTWRPRGWDHDTTVQVTVTPNGDRTVLRFHQDRLADSEERAHQRSHWRRVMSRVVDALGGA